MERNEKRRADALDNYWDAVQRMDAASRTADVDKLTAAMIELLNQQPVLAEGQAAQQRVRREIVDAAKRMQVASGNAMSQKNLSAPKSRKSLDVDMRRPASRQGWVVLAFAALLLLTTAGAGFWLTRDDSTEPLAIMAPIFAPLATPTLLESAPLLFSFTIPEEQLPSVDVAGSGLTYWKVPPGNSSRWEPTCCPGPLLQYVVAGNYSVTFDSDFQLIRADGTVEQISANSEATLGSGDALIAQNDDVMTASNVGTSPLEILQWNLIDDDNGAFSGRPIPSWTMLSRDVAGPDLFAAPVDVRVAQVIVPAETRLTPPPGSYLFASTSLHNPAGSPVSGGTYVKLGDGSIANPSSSAVTIYVLTMEQAHPPPSVPPLWR